MRCPFCGASDTQVKDSRPGDDGLAIRRRRHCASCDSRFTTFERVQLRELTVIKSNGHRRPFDRDKILRSIQVAVRKRDIPTAEVEDMVTRIVRQLEASGEAEIPSVRIGECVMRELRQRDQVAYIRYASVYKNFREARDFEAVVEELASITTH